jgi:hypothetical protein
LHLGGAGALSDLDIANSCPLKGNSLDFIAALGGAADVMAAAFVFENGNRVAVPVGYQKITPLAVEARCA